MTASDIVIRAEGLGKSYVIGHQAESERYISLRDTMVRSVRRVASAANGIVRGQVPGPAQSPAEEFWALKDVSFAIKRGEVVGIIGRNGAGKSTLLKILSRITEPTKGRVELEGRVASLLEVGTGFHPELTGRENIYLNGAILGMTQAEVRRKFDEIVAFSGVERFIDTPVKRYSSGMYVRLAFAVAAHLEPEILVVDEVLAVGDADFQKKCLGKMQSVAGSGRTVLFVSHNMAAIEQLCSRAIYLTSGGINCSGDVRNVVAEYLASSIVTAVAYTLDSDQSRPAEIASVMLCDKNGNALEHVTAAEVLCLRIAVVLRERRTDFKLAVALSDMREQPLFSSCPLDDGVPYPAEPGRYEYLMSLPGPLLMPQRYSITASAYSSLAGAFHVCHNALTFDVTPAPSHILSAEPNRLGALQVHCQWKRIGS